MLPHLCCLRRPAEVYELLFKQVLHEIDSVRAIFSSVVSLLLILAQYTHARSCY